MKKIPVIVVFSHVIGLAIIRSLGKEDIPIIAVHYQDNEFAHKSKYVSRHHRITSPLISEEQFIQDLISLSKYYKGGLLVPADDSAIIPIAKHKETLEEHFTVASNNWETVRKCIEKEKTYSLAEKLSVPIPRTVYCRDFNQINIVSKSFDFPFILKPTQSHLFFRIFRKKAFVIRNNDELLYYSGLLKENKLEFMLQEIIQGPPACGVNYNSYFINDQPVAEFTAQKVRLDPPFFGSPRVIVSKRVPEIIEYGRKLLRALGYQGFSCIEFKKDIKDNTYKLMEINPRHNLSGLLAISAGINFPLLTYKHLIEGDIIQFDSFIENIYWIDLLKDVVHFIRSRKQEGFSIGEYLSPYLKRHIFAVFSLLDIKPFAFRTYHLLNYLFRKGPYF